MGGVGGEGAVERKKNKPNKKINDKNYYNPSRIEWRLHAERFSFCHMAPYTLRATCKAQHIKVHHT